jgi:hypothetical protein
VPVRRLTASLCTLLVVGTATVAGVVSAPGPAGATDPPVVSGPLQPYFPPPFGASCTVHEFGEGVAPPLTGIPDDPLCVEYAKRDITLSNGGALRFLLAEPARLLIALPRCRYWQQDHWSVQLAPGTLPLIHWDGNYWWDFGAGRIAARLSNLRIGGVPIGLLQLARLVEPVSPVLAGYFRAFGQGGIGGGWAGTVPFNPACAA